MIIWHKGFTAIVEYSEEDQCWVGRVENGNDVIKFESQSLGEIETDFRHSIENYLKLANEPDTESRLE